jgi:hypothetical protein
MVENRSPKPLKKNFRMSLEVLVECVHSVLAPGGMITGNIHVVVN